MKAVYILYFVPIIVLTAALNVWNPFSLNSKSKTKNLKFDFLFAPPSLRAFAFVLLILSTVIIFHPFSSPKPDGRLHIDFLDVGQGDSALIRFPNGGKININKISSKSEYEDEPEIFEPDTPTIGEMVVSNFLWEKGYSQIDYILATHADADHIQGLLDVAKNFRVRAAIFGRTPVKDAEFVELRSILQKRGIESTTISRGDVLTFDAAKVEALYPEKNDNLEAVSDNNHSLVLRVIYGGRKFLLMGDIEKETETLLTNAPEFLRTDVIKVAHHGSRTSSTQEFINAAKTKVAVVSVGRESPYGHPHEEVVERWKSAGAKVLTTGENGTISISTDGQDLQLKTFNKEKFYR
jgi:competence protein ComEC